jgi:CDP-diacylglycerol---glycerol-3-phosphate 3-phosphatidyltransferase
VFTDRARHASRGIVEPIAAACARLGISPNALTVTGCALHAGVAWLLASGHLGLGAIALALCAGFDGIDGALARITGRVSRAGAFLDSTLDRVSEILVFFGLLVYALRLGDPITVALVYVVIAGSLMVSYTRARSEGIGCPTRVGVFGRLERTVILVLGLLLHQVTVTLWILALGTVVTTVHRIGDVLARCREHDA